METKLHPILRFPEFSNIWESKRLGDIAKFSKGKGILKSDIVEDGINECIRYGQLYTTYSEVINSISSRTNVELSVSILSEENDVIIPSSGETQLDIATASCILKNGVILGGDLNIIKSKINGVFLSYLLNNSKKKDIAKLAQGNAVVHLYNKQLASLMLNLPSADEQQKIASFLTDVDDKITKLTKKKDLLEQYKKGIMQKIFNQELRFTDENGNEFPKWEEKKLVNIGQIITGKTPSTSNKELWDGDIQFVTPTDINEDEKYQINTKRTVSKNEKLKVLPKNSIMYTCIASIGKMALSINPCITNQQINSLLPSKEYNNEYIYYAILKITPKIKSTQANTTLPIINKTEFSKFKIPVPSLKEQTKIANFLSDIDMKIEALNTKIENSKVFKKGLLQKMLA